MADVEIDVSGEEGTFEVLNVHLSFIRVEGCGLSLELSWEQAEQIYRQMREFFDG